MFIHNISLYFNSISVKYVFNWSHCKPQKHVFAMHIITLFFPIFLTSRSNDKFERRGDDGRPEGGIIAAELEEEQWVASGVWIL